MRIYLDTADTKEIARAAAIGIIDGVTTNPSLVAKHPEKSFEDIIREIITLVSSATRDFTVSAEVTAQTSDGMIAQAKQLARISPHVLVKIPITQEGITATRQLAKEGVRVNMTLCFSTNQALLAAKAGAWCVSPFIGRLDDAGQDGITLVENIRLLYDNHGFSTRILAASIRSTGHVERAALAGADIATIPYTVYEQIFLHPLTDAGLARFTEDWKQYLEARNG